MMPELVREFIKAHNMEDWEVFPRLGHWFALNYNSGKEYFLI